MDVAKHIRQECYDWYHPEHYPTFMPEQEYLGRLMGCVDFLFGTNTKHFPARTPTTVAGGWRHVSARFNFEIDKNRRVPFDFSTEHQRLAENLDEIVVFHYSGKLCKPWDFIWERADSDESGGENQYGNAEKSENADKQQNSWWKHTKRTLECDLQKRNELVVEAEKEDPRIGKAILEWLSVCDEVVQEVGGVDIMNELLRPREM